MRVRDSRRAASRLLKSRPDLFTRLVYGRRGVILIATLALFLALASPGVPADAVSYDRISGEGSSWAANAIDAMRVNVKQYGMTVDYTSSGSTSGRKNFLNGTVDFSASDIPFQFHPDADHVRSWMARRGWFFCRRGDVREIMRPVPLPGERWGLCDGIHRDAHEFVPA